MSIKIRLSLSIFLGSVLLFSAFPVFAQLQTDSNRVKTKVGNPPTTAAGGWPTTGTVTQGPFGGSSHARIYGNEGKQSLDIANFLGTPIYSSFDGIATVHDCKIDGDCGNGWGGLGSSVVVTSNNGAFSVDYGHLSDIEVSEGQAIKAGDLLGDMGNSGHAEGTHLHWQFSKGFEMAPPNIPEAINPTNCDPDFKIPCKPSYVSPEGSGI